MRFGFLLKRGKTEAARVGADLAALLRAHGDAFFLVEEDGATIPGATVLPAADLGKSVDVLIVLGGDGTFLYGASLVADHGVPILGINLGRLGFMTQYALDDARSALEAVRAGALSVEERMRLQVTVRVAGRDVDSRSALNEAAVTQKSMARLVDLRAELDGNAITTYKADGVILSTPTGSTAYSLAAGGPILTPDVDAIVLTPISPHTLTNRPVVMRADARVVITNVTQSQVMVTVDGQWTRDLNEGDSIEVRKADRPLRTFRTSSSFFAVLRQKLSWGERQG